MKKKLCYATVLVILLSADFCFGQGKNEKYCEVYVREGLFHKVSLNFGSQAVSFNDSLANEHLLEIKKLKNSVDVLDYMSRLGWSLESSLYDHYNEEKIFYFKKTFDQSQLSVTHDKDGKSSN